ncbi:exodeoxyribonuclease VII large subunit [Salegentibacter sp. F188]|uniref:Exodeoxyribonuclease 7 large subunit n=1 Tax=Autumnicola patrickiae TaxID=3075591 RepID=A0ABU3E2S7_9FLAO|nr:exodeoxyribonuclease VII large subunit [Salegentibacter sp. F188]MDT0690271.1 exodeoxyribonuclease VII large subunit [Salegentibacter sp. F188]
MSEKKIFSLSSLSRSIEKVIHTQCNKIVWIKAEIVKLNHYPKSGHCYPTLVEKKNGKVIAEMRGNIWASHFETINTKFKSVLREELKNDMTVVIQGSVTYHPIHGLALNIIDIDPEYTLGELAREKAETIARLKAENIFAENKKLNLPVLPKTIAVISVQTSKGYQDFLDVIDKNPWKYKFHHLLFPAILQGERSTKMILEQLDNIQKYQNVFDAVAIIRGGGGEIGLSSFDNYLLAKRIATFPLPVLTGIGHATNETVSELVSFQSFITPTKIAEFLLQKYHDFAMPLKEAEQKIQNHTNWLFKDQKNNLKETARLFSSFTQRSLDRSKAELNQYVFQLKNFSRGTIEEQKMNLLQTQKSILSLAQKPIKEEQKNLKFTQEKIGMLSPENILKRGFSITRQNGKIIRNTEELDPEVLLETQLYSGTIDSRIEKINKNPDND